MRIFVTGSIAYDYIMVFPGRFRDHILPDKMHVLSVSFLVDSLTRLRGGTGANIAYNLGLLKERPVLVGSVGEDFAEYRSWLEGHGDAHQRLPIAIRERRRKRGRQTDRTRPGRWCQGDLRVQNSVAQGELMTPLAIPLARAVTA